MRSTTRAVRMSMLLIALTMGAVPVAHAGNALGFRAGGSDGPDHVYLGFQAEFDAGLANARFSPSLDFGLDDDAVTVLNADLRWYLLPLPETGLRFYGAAGPGIVLSPDTDLGLQLTAGLHIPMQGGRRYNVELRFGFGDVPDLKLGAAILFPL